jgi:hypothetical protein
MKLAFCLSLLVCLCISIDAKADGLSIDLVYVKPAITVKHLPESFRNVPIHPDDHYVPAENAGPVSREEYGLTDGANLSLMYVWDFKQHEHPRYRLGLGLDWILFPTAGYGGTEAERNYTNNVGSDERGYGAALTFVRLREGGVIPSLGDGSFDPFLNITPRIKFEIAPFDDHFWFGTSISYFAVQAQNGWDRFDSDEVRETKTLAHDFPIRLYATWCPEGSKDKGWGIIGGAQIQSLMFKTDFGRQAGVSVDPVTFFIGVTAQF